MNAPQSKKLKLMIAGQLTTLAFAADTSIAAANSGTGVMQPAHGTGYDGMTKVESFEVGTHPGHPGKIFLTDIDGNTTKGTTHELFVALQKAEPDYVFTATKKV